MSRRDEWAVGDEELNEDADWSPDQPLEEEESGRRPVELAGAPPWIISGAVHLVLLAFLAMIVMGGVFTPEPFLTTNFEPQRPRQDTDDPDPTASPTTIPIEAKKIVRNPVRNIQKVPVEDQVRTKTDQQRENTARGEQDFLSNVPLGLPGILDVMGLGGGGAGSFGTRDGGSMSNACTEFGGQKARAPVALGLKWLADHQEPNGQWDCARYGGMDNEYASVAVTGLALLAFLGAGHTEENGLHQDNVRRALDWLAARQRPDGAFAENNYAHNMCALAVAESYGMSFTRRDMAQRAIDYLCAQQQEGGGWDYGDKGDPRRNRNDTSITCWAVMALKSARIADLDVPPGVFADAQRHFGNIGATSEAPGSLAYAIQGNDIQVGGNAIRAMTMLSMQYLGSGRDDPFIVDAANILREENPQLNNLYKLYYATLAMFNMGGDEYWTPWNAGMRDPLIAQQVTERGDNLGSWDPAGRTYGSDGGRVYSTAMSVLCLEVYYRYLPVYGDQR